MNLRALLNDRFAAALAKCGATDAPALVQPSNRPEFGDYQANGVMGAAKRLKLPPRELAEQVIAAVELDGIQSALSVAGPGFINITLADDFLAAQCQSSAAIVTATNEPQTVVVDYSSPNLAKEMHVGHIRSTIIGDALARMFELLGHKVIRQNHVGDWGTQFGMLITELDWQGEQSTEFALNDLEDFYRQAKAHYDSDPKFAEAARLAVVALQQGDAKARESWQRFVDLSLTHSQELYDRLGVSLTRADVQPESAYNDALPGVIEQLKSVGLYQESDGAGCVFLNEFKNKAGDALPVIVQKSDGGYLYATTDLAAIQYRTDTLAADRVLYLVDARQSLHFKQIFTLAKLAGFANESISLEHLPFGTMLGADGKPFKTRDGGVVKLASLLDAAVDQAAKLIQERDTDLTLAEQTNAAEVIGVGAVKYADLSKNRTTDYVFDLEQMISFEGDTAPYLQYAYTRIISLFRRAELKLNAQHATPILDQPSERDLGLTLARFQEVLEQSVAEGFPHYLTGYLHELASRYSKFYENCPVLKSEGVVQASRLSLCARSAKTLQIGLELLGIKTLEKM